MGAEGARAQALVIELSDAHTSYDRLALFLRAVDATKAEYKKRNPEGEVVIIVNGDFTGSSAWSDDRGWLAMRALAVLARENHVLYTLGNHDGFDWGKIGNGNQLVHEQLKHLSMNRVVMLGSNIVFAPDSEWLIQKHFDLVGRSGRKTRFVGLGLPDFFSNSKWDPLSPIRVISEIRPALPTLMENIKTAVRDGVQDFVFFQHEGSKEVSSLTRELQSELEKAHLHQRIRVPLAFAAHDHLHLDDAVGETRILDAGSEFDFSVVELNASGAITRREIMDRRRQEDRATNLVPTASIREFILEVDGEVDRIRGTGDRVVGTTHGFATAKLDLKKGRDPLGNALAESFRIWAQDFLREQHSPYADLPVIAFMNSASYRREAPIPAGPLTASTVRSFYPFSGDVTAFLATGSEVSHLFASLRQWRLANSHDYSPQITANVLEGQDYKLELVDGRSLNANLRVVIVLDDWLAINGYQLPEFQKFLDTHPALAREEQTTVFLRTAPIALSTMTQVQSCRAQFLN